VVCIASDSPYSHLPMLCSQDVTDDTLRLFTRQTFKVLRTYYNLELVKSSSYSLQGNSLHVSRHLYLVYLKQKFCVDVIIAYCGMPRAVCKLGDASTLYFQMLTAFKSSRHLNV
jgi:hypothetical protein